MTAAAILLVGAGGHARACIDVIEQEARYTVAGLVGLPEEVGQSVLRYPVLGTDAELPTLLGGIGFALVSVGQIRSAAARVRLYDLLKRAGAELPVVVSPRAYVSPHAEIGEGTIVLHGAVVNAGAVVGRNCILNNQALVEHDVVVSDHCHIATGARLNSGVRIDTGTFVGSGACVRQSVTIGERCVIGMGQQVLRDVPAGSVLPVSASRS